jgi:hypothetical protein
LSQLFNTSKTLTHSGSVNVVGNQVQVKKTDCRKPDMSLSLLRHLNVSKNLTHSYLFTFTATCKLINTPAAAAENQE